MPAVLHPMPIQKEEEEATLTNGVRKKGKLGKVEEKTSCSGSLKKGELPEGKQVERVEGKREAIAFSSSVTSSTMDDSSASPPSPPPPPPSTPSSSRSCALKAGVSRLRRMRDRFTLLTLQQRLQHLSHCFYLSFLEWRQVPKKRELRALGEALETAIRQNRLESFQKVCCDIRQCLHREDADGRGRRVLSPSSSSSSSASASLACTFRSQLVLLYARALTNFGVHCLLRFDTERAAVLLRQAIEVVTETMTVEEEESIRASLATAGMKSTTTTTAKAALPTAMSFSCSPSISSVPKKEEARKTAPRTDEEKKNACVSQDSTGAKASCDAASSASVVPATTTITSTAKTILQRMTAATVAITTAVNTTSKAPFFSRASSVIYLHILLGNALACEQQYWEAAQEFQQAHLLSHVQYPAVATIALVQLAPGLCGYQPLSRAFVQEEALTFHRHIRVLEEAIDEGEDILRSIAALPSSLVSLSTPERESDANMEEDLPPPTVGPTDPSLTIATEKEDPDSGVPEVHLRQEETASSVGSGIPLLAHRAMLLRLARLYSHIPHPSKAQEYYEAYLQSLVQEGVEDAEYVMIELGRFLLYGSSLSTGRSPASFSLSSMNVPGVSQEASNDDEDATSRARVALIYLEAGSKLLVEEAWMAFQAHYVYWRAGGEGDASETVSLGSRSRSIQLCVRAASVLMDYAYALFRSGQGRKAVNVLQRSIRWMEKTGLQYHSVLAITLCGDMWSALGQMDNALLQYSKAMDLLEGSGLTSFTFPSLPAADRRSSPSPLPPQMGLCATCVPLHVEEIECHLAYCLETAAADYPRAIHYYRRALSRLMETERSEGTMDEDMEETIQDNDEDVAWSLAGREKRGNADRGGSHKMRSAKATPSSDTRASSSASFPEGRKKRRRRNVFRQGSSTRPLSVARTTTTTTSPSSSSDSISPYLSFRLASPSSSSFPSSPPESTSRMLAGYATPISPVITPEAAHWMLERLVGCESARKGWTAAVQYQKQIMQIESHLSLTPVASSLKLAALLQQEGNTKHALAIYFTLFFLPDEMLTPATRLVVARKFGRCCYRLSCAQMGVVLLQAVKEAQGGCDPMTLLDLGLCCWTADTTDDDDSSVEVKTLFRASQKIPPKDIDSISRTFKRAASLVVAYREIDQQEKAVEEGEERQSVCASTSKKKKALRSRRQVEEDDLQAITVLNRGAFFFLEIGEKEKAMELYSMALRICEEADSPVTKMFDSPVRSATPVPTVNETHGDTDDVEGAGDGTTSGVEEKGGSSSSSSTSVPSRASPSKPRVRSAAFCQEWSVVLANSAMILAHSDGRKEDALRLYRKASKVSPDSFPILNAAALFCQSEGLQEDACLFLKRALQVPVETVSEKFHFSLCQLGETLYEKTDVETRCLLLERAILSLGVPESKLRSSSRSLDATNVKSTARKTEGNGGHPAAHGETKEHTEVVANPVSTGDSSPPHATLSQRIENLSPLFAYGMRTTKSAEVASFVCYLLLSHFPAKAALVNRVFRIAITRFPHHPQLLFNYGNFCAFHHFFFLARLYYSRGVALQENTLAAVHVYAAHLQDTTAFGTSSQAGTQELLLRTHAEKYHTRTYYALLLYRQFPSPCKCEAEFEKALSEDPSNVVILSHYAEFLCLSLESVQAATNLNVRSERLKRIEELLCRCVDISPDTSSTHYHLGIFYMNCDRKADALASFKQALERNPKDVEALRSFASLMHQECLQEIETFLLSRQRSPSSSLEPVSTPSSFSSLAVGTNSESHHSSATEERTKALLRPRFPIVIQEKLAQTEKCYELAVALEPDHLPTLEEYAQFCIRGLDNPTRAKEMWVRISTIRCRLDSIEELKASNETQRK